MHSSSFVNAGSMPGHATATNQQQFKPQYASMPGPMPHPGVFTHRNTQKRKRSNLVVLLFALFAPWFLFVVLYAIMCFRFHFVYPQLTWFLQLAAFVPAIGTKILAVHAWHKGNNPQWYAYTAVALCIAVFAAASFGTMNFEGNMKPFYNVQHLMTYPSVNPARDRGSQMMDAGAVYFAEGTGLDPRRAMGFKSKDLYCVAPIVNGNGKMASYDFWAVGKNCCSGVSSDFRCGDYMNPKASGGLRMLHDDERAYYRLAVQQAEAAYKVKAAHPVFFTWVADPVAEANSWREQGYYDFTLCCLGYFAFNAFCVACATICFTVFNGLKQSRPF